MTTAFDTALAEYQRCRQAELALPERKTDAEEEAHRDVDNAALDATTEAFKAMAAIPTTDGRQIAAKLRTLSEFYELGCCGCDRKLLEQVLAEVDASLTGKADPHMDWLAERDDLLRDANTREMSDDECSKVVADACEVDRLIFETPATTREGILAKALVIVGEKVGSANTPGAAERVFAEAVALGLMEYAA